MIIRHNIWYVHINIYMIINMLHIWFINFPFAHRVTEFLISLRTDQGLWSLALQLPRGCWTCEMKLILCWIQAVLQILFHIYANYAKFTTKLCKKNAQYAKNMQRICKEYAKYKDPTCKIWKNYAQNMQLYAKNIQKKLNMKYVKNKDMKTWKQKHEMCKK